MREATQNRTPGHAYPEQPAMNRMNQKWEATGTSRIARRLSAVLFAGLVLVGACEGDNLFSGDVTELKPRIVNLSLPPAAFAGSSVNVRVDAQAGRGVAQIVVALRGALSKDTTVTINPSQQRVSKVVSFAVPLALSDTVLLVGASVIDEAGDQSSLVEGAIAAFGPPVVTAVTGPSGIRAGERINVRVTAFGARKVARLDLSARGAVTTDTSVIMSPALPSVVSDIELRIPTNVQDTVITLNVTAQDALGAQSAARSVLLPLAIDTPSVELLVPPSVEAGRILTLGVQASSVRQISEIRVELRGGVVKDTSVKVLPTRVTTLEFINVGLPASLTSPDIRVRAFALDRANTVSATDVFTVSAPQGAPSIVLVDPFASTLEAGDYADFRVQAIADRPIKELRFRWRGFIADSLKKSTGGPETRLTIDPARTSVVEDASVQTPCLRSDGIFMVLVTARDQDDHLSPIVTATLSLMGNQTCQTPVDSVPVDTTSGPRVKQRVPAGLLKNNGGFSMGSAVPALQASRSVQYFEPAALFATRASSKRGRRVRSLRAQPSSFRSVPRRS